jgi:putative FmdB family regulatory protein
MPVYEYRCQDCGQLSSALLWRYSDPDPPCPGCGSAQVSRLVSRFATVRSGDGGGDDLGGGDDFSGGGEDYGGGGEDWGDDDY